MSEVRELLNHLESEGVKIAIDKGDLCLRGKRPEAALLERVRVLKPKVIEELQGDEIRRWEKLRELGAMLGKWVTVDGRQCRLWGVTARGPIVDTGAFVISVDTDAITFAEPSR